MIIFWLFDKIKDENNERIGDKYMKAATGELNLTVITLLAIAAIIAFFWIIYNNNIKPTINSQWENISTYNGDW